MPTIQLKIDNRVVNILFVHIPKSGGTAIIDFWKRAQAGIYLHNENNPITGYLKCSSQHFHYEIMEMIYNIDRFDFSFAIVRNPIERAKSDFLWSQRTNESEKLPSFEGWLEYVFEGYQSNPYFFDNHIRPQSDFVGSAIKKIYKYEDGLEKIIIDVLGNLGVKVLNNDTNLLHRKNSSKENNGIKTSDLAISQKAKQLIYDFYAQDFQKFQYN